jgi:pimeloyl-ACP methyl ester carboxylesterase
MQAELQPPLGASSAHRSRPTLEQGASASGYQAALRSGRCSYAQTDSRGVGLALLRLTAIRSEECSRESRLIGSIRSSTAARCVRRRSGPDHGTMAFVTQPIGRTVAVDGAELDVVVEGENRPDSLTVSTTHPIESMHQAVPAIVGVTGARVVSVNPRGVGGSSPPRRTVDSALETLADDLDPDADASADAGDPTWEELPGTGWALRLGSGPALLVAPSIPSAQMRRILPILLTFDARPWLGTIAVPTLVLGGAKDRIAPPAQLRALHEAIPGSDLVLIEGAGHVPLGEGRPEVAAAVRRFLDVRVKR